MREVHTTVNNIPMADKKPTEIASLGEFGLIDHLTDSFSVRNASTLRGVGDDAAVIAAGADEVTLCTTDLLLEGVDFDLTYFPLKHLGYKAVVVAVSDLLAMNGRPEQLLVSLGVSSKISVEALDDLYAGIRFACEEMEVDLVGGDTKASVTGLAIHVTALGRARKEEVVYRGGAKLHDLICITGNLGAAYMGLQLLEREKRVLRGVKDPEPEFKGNEYLLQRYLKPVARKDIVELLAEEKIVPTSMIDLSDGLASDLLQICKASKCGARIYLDRIPIAGFRRGDSYRSRRGGAQRRRGLRVVVHRAAGPARAGDAHGRGRCDRTYYGGKYGCLPRNARWRRDPAQSPGISG